MSGSVTVLARAKVNLHLEVIGRRPDGFHELRTVLQTIDLHDTLELRSATHGRVSLRSEPSGTVPDDERNLIVQAVHRLATAMAIEPSLDIRLQKRIPVGAGLGGGSADAAATLLALCQLWEETPPPELVWQVAAALGSDVPFFLTGGTAVGVGRGEEIYPLPPIPELALVVAWPRQAVSTAAVYAALDVEADWRAPARWPSLVAAGRQSWQVWGAMSNDLQPVVEAMVPAVARVRQAIAATGPVLAAVTGSGGASFGVYEDGPAARRAAQKIAAHADGVHVGTLYRPTGPGRW